MPYVQTCRHSVQLPVSIMFYNDNDNELILKKTLHIQRTENNKHVTYVHMIQWPLTFVKNNDIIAVCALRPLACLIMALHQAKF